MPRVKTTVKLHKERGGGFVEWETGTFEEGQRGGPSWGIDGVEGGLGGWGSGAPQKSNGMHHGVDRMYPTEKMGCLQSSFALFGVSLCATFLIYVVPPRFSVT